MGGALKNIYAIATGITKGLNLGENSSSALITRSFAEINRFATALGAKSKTVYGLSGLGDLILTCNSLKSRNTTFGQLIASQQKILISEHLKSNKTIVFCQLFIGIFVQISKDGDKETNAGC